MSNEGKPEPEQPLWNAERRVFEEPFSREDYDPEDDNGVRLPMMEELDAADKVSIGLSREGDVTDIKCEHCGQWNLGTTSKLRKWEIQCAHCPDTLADKPLDDEDND